MVGTAENGGLEVTEMIRVLVVDDDPVDREAVRRALLRSDVSIEVDEAADVASGTRKLATGQFDCALVDYYLPDGDARDFLDARDIMDQVSLEPASEPPIVILTGHGSERMAVELLKSGASDYVPKTEMTPSRLGQAVRNAVHVSRMRKRTCRALESLREIEACCRILFHEFPEALILTDSEGMVIDANVPACGLLATTREDAVGKLFGQAASADLPGDLLNSILERVRAVARGGQDQPSSISLGPLALRVAALRTVSSGEPAVLLQLLRMP